MPTDLDDPMAAQAADPATRFAFDVAAAVRFTGPQLTEVVRTTHALGTQNPPSQSSCGVSPNVRYWSISDCA